MTYPSDIAGLLASLQVRHGDPKPSISTLYDAANLIEKLVAERDEALDRSAEWADMSGRWERQYRTAEQALEAAQANVGVLEAALKYIGDNDTAYLKSPVEGAKGYPGHYGYTARKALAEGGGS